MRRCLHLTVHPANPQPRPLAQAVAVLRSGGVVALPTASGYQLCGRLDDKAATTRMRRLAGAGDRDAAVLLCRDLTQAAHHLRIDDREFRAIRAGVPGAAAHLLACTKRMPRRLADAGRGHAQLYFPGHGATLALLQRLDEPLLLAPATWGPGPDNVDGLPLPWRQAIDAVLDAGPVAARDVFAPQPMDSGEAPAHTGTPHAEPHWA